MYQGLQISRPFILGNVARAITPDERLSDTSIPSNHTHRWTFSIRNIGENASDSQYDEPSQGKDDDQLSCWIKKVQVKLHETYNNNHRTIDKPPYVISETGWGEFELQIKIHLNNESGEKPLTLHHMLKLHPWNQNYIKNTLDEDLPPTVNSWQYDEIVFTDPYESFYNTLISNPPPSLPQNGKISVESQNIESSRLVEAKRQIVQNSTKLRNDLIGIENQLKGFINK